MTDETDPMGRFAPSSQQATKRRSGSQKRHMNAPIPVRFTAGEWADAEREASAAGASSTVAYLRAAALEEIVSHRGEKPATKRNPPQFIPATPEQKQRIEALAERAGLSVGSYIRARGLKRAVTLTTRRAPIEKGELARIYAELGSIRGNTNQIAHVANVSGNIKAVEQIELVHRQLEAVRQIVAHALGRGPGG